MDDTDKVQIFVRDAQDNGVEVLPPDVNASGYRFEPVADKHTEQGKPPRTMRYGLGAVKGTGQGAVEEILRARQEGGPFANLFDFCRRVSKHAVNRRTIEALIKAGAFDTIEPNRAAMLVSVGTAMEAAEQAARSANQSSLFGDDSGDVVAGELTKVAPWNLHTTLTEERRRWAITSAATCSTPGATRCAASCPCSWRAWSRSATCNGCAGCWPACAP